MPPKATEKATPLSVAESPKRKAGRPRTKTENDEVKPAKVVEPKTKVVDGKVMKRSMKKVLTGKRGRPRKESIWTEVNKK